MFRVWVHNNAANRPDHLSHAAVGESRGSRAVLDINKPASVQVCGGGVSVCVDDAVFGCVLVGYCYQTLPVIASAGGCGWRVLSILQHHLHSYSICFWLKLICGNFGQKTTIKVSPTAYSSGVKPSYFLLL